LDEPTNHLDIPAQEVLQEVLEQFAGTILLVSHDRYLVDRLATQVWDLRHDGQLSVFKGPYQEFLTDRERRMSAAKQGGAKQRSESRQQMLQARKVDNASKKRERAVAEMELKIQQMEMSLAQLAADLQAASAAGAFDKIQRLSAEYAAKQGRLEQLMSDWERQAAETVPVE